MNFFDKNNYDITDIQWLIDNNIEEGTNLDFKASGSLGSSDGIKKEIAKDISAFANSAGGIIVYGLTEQNHKATAFSFIDGNIFTKEWLEHVISSNIDRRITDLKIYPIRNNSNISETIYVVKIPESDNAPHMSKDGRFYKRFNFESLQMQEFEIRQLYNRMKKSILEFEEINITGGHLYEKNIDDFKDTEFITIANKYLPKYNLPSTIKVIGYDLSVVIKNIGRVPEDKFQLQITSPLITIKGKPIVGSNERNIIRSQPYKLIERKNDELEIITVPSYSLIFPNEIIEIWKCSVYVHECNLDIIERNPIVKFNLFYSDGVAKREINLIEELRYNEEKINIEMVSNKKNIR